MHLPTHLTTPWWHSEGILGYKKEGEFSAGCRKAQFLTCVRSHRHLGRGIMSCPPRGYEAHIRPHNLSVSNLLALFTLSHPEQAFERCGLKRSVERNHRGAEGAGLTLVSHLCMECGVTYSANPYRKDAPDTVAAFPDACQYNIKTKQFFLFNSYFI